MRPLYKPGLPHLDLYWKVNLAKMHHILLILPWLPACMEEAQDDGSAG
jgi:hypothetical protein